VISPRRACLAKCASRDAWTPPPHCPAAAERIAAFLGGGLDVDKMVAAVDSSLYRNRRAS
jgi:hypothetical protein